MNCRPLVAWRSALVVAAALLATGCTADSDAPAFDIPFDFKDSFYRANGIDPTKLINRLTPAHPSATTGTSIDPTRNSTRILHTFGGYDTVGEPLYYPLPPAPFKADAFLPNEQGKRAREIANRFRAFIFPRRDGDRVGSGAPNRREDNVFDTSSGYLTKNPLGLWRLTFPRCTDKALNTVAGKQAMNAVRAINGTDLDSTPIIKRLSEIIELEKLGYLELIQRPEDGSMGPPWVV